MFGSAVDASPSMAGCFLQRLGTKMQGLGFKVQGLPKGCYVVPFWVCYGSVVMDYTILPKKELHRRVLGKRTGGNTITCQKQLSSILFGYYGTQYRVRLYPPFKYSILCKEYNLTRLNHQKNTTQLSPKRTIAR